MIARCVGYVLGSAFDALVRNAFGVVGSLATWLQPSEVERRAVAQADALAAAEECFEVYEPEGHALFRDGGWWFHNEDTHPFTPLPGSKNCQVCGCPQRYSQDAHIAAVREAHRVNEDVAFRDGLWCMCGQFCLNLTNHQAHVDQVIAELLAADARVQPAVRKYQAMTTDHNVTSGD